jgi:superfamily I DNA and/or RNA helicase
LIAQKKQIPLCDILDSRFEKVNEISKQLRKIARNEVFIETERGAKDLYVGYPIVKGKLANGTSVRCPLIFFPVTLHQDLGKNNKWVLANRDEPISLNRSFLLAYSHFNQVPISDEWLDKTFEDFSQESLTFRTELYELLKESPLKINFNQELFTNQLTHFERLSKSDLEFTEKNGELKLYPQAILGIFPQAGSYLVPDYEHLLVQNQEITDNGLENLFDKVQNQTTNATKEANSVLPFAVDASQELAIQEVKNGKSIVVQGPPGTGKSQLICNLVADFTARGKKVLVVCQKRVALDTVYQRLEQVQMSDFVGLIHDFKNDRKDLFQKIANQIDHIEAYKKQNQGLDAIFLDRNFTQISRRIDQITRELQEFKNALFDESICGVSVKELYLTCSPKESNIELNKLHKQFKINELNQLEAKFRQYFAYIELLKKQLAGNFWENRISFAKMDFTQQKTIQNHINAIDNFQNKTKQFQNKFIINSEYSITNNIYIYTEITDNINNSIFTDRNINFDFTNLIIISNYFENKEIFEIFKYSILNKKLLKNDELEKFHQNLSQIYASFGLEKSIETHNLELVKIQLAEAITAADNAINWFTWKLFSKAKKSISYILTNNNLNLQKTDLQILKKRIDNRIVFEKVAKALRKKGIEIDKSEDWGVIDQTLKNYILASKAVSVYHSSEFLKSSTILNLGSVDELIKFKNELVDLLNEFNKLLTHCKDYLSKQQIKLILEQKVDKELIIRDLQQNFDLFIACDELIEGFTNSETELVELLKPNAENVENWIRLLQNSVRLAWIQEIEERNPILKGVSTLKISQLEEELQSCINQKKELSQEILLIKLREQTYKDLVINRLQNIVSYRELYHQVTKKRKIWSVRRVIEQYNDEIFKLIPCWMASPESVSALFNLETKFDLVIFDEASQCFAESGIPAIYRGKQVAIAGDSKQLQPNDLYQIRYEEDVEDEPILEIDSLLDLASQYLPQVQLKGHYRSKSLDLIDFSNTHFYKQTLSLLPDYQEITKKQPAIHYIKVNGFWEHNSNITEAEKIAEIIQDLQRNNPQKTIGIVTFNYKQADLIESLIPYLKKNIFIKNIENIQGDEFDFVIFSIGYAPDLKGRMVMNFGSLNQQGGENRLNVAVTRAKEKIYVVCSILPNQLRVEDAINEGPKLLKKYLEFALEVSNGEFVPKPLVASTSAKSLSLQQALINRNSQYINELPFADITVKDKDAYESLILTDDNLYFQSTSPKETHAYLPFALAQKNWRFRRIWSREFWQDTLK